MSLSRVAVLVWLSMLPAAPLMADEMKFSIGRTGGNCSDCIWIAAQGEITSATPTHFVEFLNLHRSSKYEIRIHSTGGDLRGALVLGALIRNFGLPTGIARTVPAYKPPACGGVGPPCDLTVDEPGECLSACVYAFAGGTERRIDKADRIGVHQFYDRAALSVPNKKRFSALDRAQDQVTFSILLGYLDQMGISAELAEIAGKTAPDEITYLDAEVIRRTGIANMYWRAAEWRIEPYQRGAIAISDTTYGPYFSVSASVFCSINERHRANLTISLNVSRYLKTNPGPLPITGVIISPMGDDRPTSKVRFPITRTVVSRGSTSLTFDIADILPRLIASRGFSLNLDAPMVFHRFYPDVVTLTGLNFAISDSASQALALALRNCI